MADAPASIGTAPTTLLGQKAAILAGVDLGAWGPLIDDAKLDAALRGVDTLGDGARTAPPPALILEALRYGRPDEYHVVLNGQDPYPGAGEAQGVCFSTPRDQAVPESLKRIFGCLDRAGLRRERQSEDGRRALASGDLRTWAVQGVLMLNAALTTRVGARRAHAAEWKPFVSELLRRFCEHHSRAGRRLQFLLWGGDAREFAPVARRFKHDVREWSHPSPMADNKLPAESRFRECPHFEETNAALSAAGLRPIVWDNLSPVIGFSDGSCPRNGAADARASFAAVITGGAFGAAVLRGEVAPFGYAFADPDDPLRGLAVTGAPVVPTNNRGELLGICYCFLGLLRGRAAGRAELVSDSNICVQTLLEWLPARLKKGTERELKNFDLVAIAWRLLGELRKQAAFVVLTHTRSHQPAPPADAEPRVRFVHRGNEMADEHAAVALEKETPDYSVEILNAPAVLRPLARSPVAPASEKRG